MDPMKKHQITAFVLSLALILSLAACGEKKPSLDEVEQAIEAGTLTLDDALGKGYVTQDWVDAYIEANSVPAGDKVEANKVGDFSTATLSGEEFTKADLGNLVFFAFADPADENAPAFFQTLVDAYEGVKGNGADIVLCTKSGEGNEVFADAPFPVILWNDSLKEAVGHNSGMIEDEEIHNTASWYVNGSFLSSWSIVIDRDDLVESAAAFAGMAGGIGGDAPAGGEAAGMVPMG